MTITNQKCACNERIFYDRFGALYIGPTIRYTCCKHYIECSGKLKLRLHGHTIIMHAINNCERFSVGCCLHGRALISCTFH